MKQLRRFLVILTLITLCLTLMSLSVFAMSEATISEDVVTSGTCGNGLTWTLDGTGTLRISGIGAMNNFWAGGSPWEHNSSIKRVNISSGVTTIGDFAFYGCRNLEQIVIPEGVTDIGSAAFWCCDALTDISLPSSLKVCGSGAFAESGIIFNEYESGYYLGQGTNPYFLLVDADNDIVEIHEDTRIIGGSAFSENATLTGITIPDGVESICGDAFRQCTALTKIVIPENVVRIGDYAFADCDALISVTLPNGLSETGQDIFAYCDNLQYNRYDMGYYLGSEENPYFMLFKVDQMADDTSVLIHPDTKRIDEYMFSEFYELTDIVIPDSVNWIGDNLFYGSNSLQTATLSAGMTTVPFRTFFGCNNLTSVTIPGSIISIENNAFARCTALTDVYYYGTEADWAKINIDTGNECLTNANVHCILDSGTCGENLTWILDSEGTLTISGSGSMSSYNHEPWNDYWQQIQRLILKEGVTSVAADYFSGYRNLQEVVLPETVTSIGYNAFEGCESLSAIRLPESLETIEDKAFYGCTMLTELKIPAKVREIGQWMACESGLIAVRVDENNPYYDSDDYGVLYDEGMTTLLYMPSGFQGEYVTPRSLLYIEDYACANCAGLTAIELRPGLQKIGYRAFEECVGLKSVNLPASVIEIGSAAFAYCSSLESVNLPEYLTQIDTSVFYCCTALTQIDIPETVTTIGGSAFWGSGLISMTFPKNIRIIEFSVLAECKNLTSVYFPASLTVISDGACEGCDALKDVYFGGTESRWEMLVWTDLSNEPLLNANVHYNWVDQPSITKLENVSNGIKITWGAVEGAAQYRVYAKTSKGWVALGTTTGTSFVYTNAISGYTYTFTVRCLNDDGTAFTSSFNATGWRQKYIAQPKITKLENVANGIQITWDQVNGAENYRIYAKTSKGWVALGNTTGTSFTYTNAISGYTYTFTVRCTNSAGSAFTSTCNTTGWRQKYVAQPAVTKLENVATGIKLTWNKVSGAERYRIYAKTSKGWVCLGNTTGTSFIYTNAISGYTYTFTVRCVNAANDTFTSSCNTTGWKQKYVAQPSVTKLSNTTKGINITWGAVNGAERYRVYVKTSSGWTYIGTTTGTRFTWTGAKAGQTYTFTVRCVNAANNAFTSSCNPSGWSIKRT